MALTNLSFLIITNTDSLKESRPKLKVIKYIYSQSAWLPIKQYDLT